MAGSLGTSDGPIADINVTPLIDVVLVLLVVTNTALTFWVHQRLRA